MFVEAIDHPIRYHLADGREFRLVPGQPVDLPDIQASKLLAKAQGRVKLASTGLPCFQPGTWIEWDSPLFGRLRGELLAVREDGLVEVFNPVTETVTPIPREWVRESNEFQR